MVANAHYSHALDLGSSNCCDAGKRFSTIYIHLVLRIMNYSMVRRKREKKLFFLRWNSLYKYIKTENI